ncbi:Rhodanese-related sulfurtransferase [Paracoccus halophilus]|uniref:Rhodanese n=1 Tax=Paracoccus halophilus TaxID=376733 RepID=A0A099F1Y5_9RHOB|nr:rhodanese-like domain-containing protein [Paracoccus halophilus]KGJ04256.1 rhodanese [Paracoccus halophilus]SFA52176.1 Rhodanese-related sulfurtransferase [Paracoccus halophilus]
MARSYKDMLAEADALVTSVSVDEMAGRFRDESIVMVDIRDPRELEREGMIPGAFHAPRGMLEFWIDPESPYHRPRFAEARTYVFYCASGWRSLLATRLAQDMGLEARNLREGFSGWQKAGLPVGEKPAGRR